uniref:Geranylgeranyl transferase type II subunit beta n=1 Tax=Lygus hesperus TaxID=30085 RepID=A0A0A9WRM5_LYGHE
MQHYIIYGRMHYIAIFDKLDLVPCKVQEYLINQYTKCGGFQDTTYGEIDGRFTYCIVASLAILQLFDKVNIDWTKVSKYITMCTNFDGGFGSIPGGESHAGYVFCNIGV